MKKILIVVLMALSLAGINVQAESYLPDGSMEILNPIDLPTPDENDNGLEQLADLVLNNLVQIVRYLLISISIIYIFVNILIIVLGSSDESTIDESKTAIKHVILGLIIISLSTEFAQVFDINSGEMGDEDKAQQIFQIVINYISLLAGAVAVLFILFSASKLIFSGGEDSARDEVKKSIINAFMGLLVIIMADTMINKVFYPVEGDAPVAPGADHQTTFAQELFGIISYILEFLAIGSILLIILAGLFYITSVGNIDNTDKAKTILKNLVVGFITITIAYTIVSAFAPGADGTVIAK